MYNIEALSGREKNVQYICSYLTSVTLKGLQLHTYAIFNVQQCKIPNRNSF